MNKYQNNIKKLTLKKMADIYKNFIKEHGTYREMLNSVTTEKEYVFHIDMKNPVVSKYCDAADIAFKSFEVTRKEVRKGLKDNKKALNLLKKMEPVNY